MFTGFKYAENVGGNIVEEYASATRLGEYVTRGGETFQTFTIKSLTFIDEKKMILSVVCQNITIKLFCHCLRI